MPRRGSVPPTTDPTATERFIGSINHRLEGTGPSVSVIKGDEFHNGELQQEWDQRTAEEKASLAIDRRRQLEILQTLRRGEVARWHGYDWEAFDDSLAAEVTLTEPSDVVIVEGAYSSRPEIAGQEYCDDWLAPWTEAEDHYFSRARCSSAFDLVLET